MSTPAFHALATRARFHRCAHLTGQPDVRHAIANGFDGGLAS